MNDKKVFKLERKAGRIRLVLVALVALVLLVSLVGAVTTVNTYVYGIDPSSGVFITPSWSEAQQTAFCTAGGWGNYFPGGSARIWYHDNAYTNVYDAQNYNTYGAFDQPSENRSVTAGGGTLSVRAYTTCQNDYPDRHYLYQMTTAGWPTFNWSATPLTGPAPLTANFTIQNSTHSYTVNYGDGNITNTTDETLSHTYTNPGVYTPTIGIRNTSVSISRSNYIIVTSNAPVNATLTVTALNTAGVIVGSASIGIQNTTNNLWHNVTAASGVQNFTFTEAGGGLYYPIAIGQNLKVAASAVGYNETVSNYTIVGPNDNFYIILTSNEQQPTNGSTNFNVWVKADQGCQPLSGALVTMTTGVSGNSSSKYTDNSGLVSFIGVFPGFHTTFTAHANDNGYSDGSTTIDTTVRNKTYTVMIQLTTPKNGASGQTCQPGTQPSITPTPTIVTTTIPGYSGPTFPNGTPIPNDQQGLAAFSLLIQNLYQIMQIAIGIILIWLLWQVVYQITGGRTIDKIMRRGRRGR